MKAGLDMNVTTKFVAKEWLKKTQTVIDLNPHIRNGSSLSVESEKVVR